VTFRKMTIECNIPRFHEINMGNRGESSMPELLQIATRACTQSNRHGTNPKKHRYIEHGEGKEEAIG